MHLISNTGKRGLLLLWRRPCPTALPDAAAEASATAKRAAISVTGLSMLLPLLIALVLGVPSSSEAQATPLPAVTTVGSPSLGPRYAAFERRRKTGIGQYLLREEIERSGASNLQDAVRSLRGIQLDCGGGSGCSIRMARAPLRCPPEYVVDDVVNNTFGPTVAVRDIEALEVYTGQADVPGEYAGRNAGCGVIVIWTGAGPKRKKP